MARPVLRRPRRRVPAGGRPARRPVAREDRGRDDARAVEDRLPGRDRHALRAHRLLALQRRLRPRHPGRPAGVLPRRVEPGRPPAPRGLRLRDHAVQLHRDRRQPADRARADGQRGRLEAVAHAGPVGLPDHAAAGGRRAPGRRHQPRPRRRPRRLRGRAGGPPARRDPLHGQHRDVPVAVARGRHAHRPLPHLPPPGGGDRWQGLRPGARLGRPRGPHHRDDPRRVRLPGPEVLGRPRGPSCRARSGRRWATAFSLLSTRCATAT